MNGATVDLVNRPYAEIVDDILTSVIGGVVREPIPFDVKQVLYPLAHPATGIRTIVGTRTPPPPAPATPGLTTFTQGPDYTFDAGRNAVVWQSGGAHPDDETTFYVDYARAGVTSPLTDINVGSVTRTLCEAIAREITTVYQEINLAYLGGFIDTATGQALDQVVSILGVVRRGNDFATGLLTFLPNPAITGNITIPQGTEAGTATASATFVTTDMATLQAGQARIDIPVQATDAFRGPAGVVAAGAITTLTQPIAGIASVTNFDATVLPGAAETDAQLRARAKSTLQALSRATLAGLNEVVVEEGSAVDEVWDPNLQGNQRSDPGEVVILVKTEPARYPSLTSAVNGARAAGVLATVTARFVFFTPRVVARVPAAKLPADNAGKVKLTNEIIAAMTAPGS
jgi:acyl-coenzyme A thioesterase PaaI-like protein